MSCIACNLVITVIVSYYHIFSLFILGLTVRVTKQQLHRIQPQSKNGGLFCCIVRYRYFVRRGIHVITQTRSHRMFRSWMLWNKTFTPDHALPCVCWVIVALVWHMIHWMRCAIFMNKAPPSELYKHWVWASGCFKRQVYPVSRQVSSKKQIEFVHELACTSNFPWCCLDEQHFVPTVIFKNL